MFIPRSFTRTLMVLLFLALAGCSRSTASPEAGVEVGVQPIGEASARDQVIAEIRPVAAAVLQGIVTDRIALAQFLTTPCTTAEGLGGPPKCAEGEPDGTPVEVFPVGGSEGSFARPSEIEGAMDFSVKGLYAVYQPEPGRDPESYWPTGEYALLFDRNLNDIPMPIIALVEDGRLVRLDYRFGTSPEEILNAIPVDRVLLTPAEAQDLMTEILNR